MFKRIGVAALLAACASQEDVTQLDVTHADASSPPSPRPHPRSALRPSAASAVASPGGAKLVWATPAASTPAPAASPEAAARGHLASPAALQRQPPGALAELELEDVHDTGLGAIIARFERRVSGLPVFGQRVSVAMDRQLRPLALSGELKGALPSVAKAAAGVLQSGPVLSAADAALAAIEAASGVRLELADLGRGAPAAGGYELLALSESALARLGAPPGTVPARARLILFPAATKQLVPAYHVEADTGRDEEGRPRYFAHVVSASDGRVLWQNDLTMYEAFTYRVHADPDGLFTPWDGPHGTELSPHPSGVPEEDFSPAFVPSQLVTVSSLESLGVTDPWLPDGARESVGNNVDAYLDLSPPDGFTLGLDVRAQVSAPGVFGAELDPLSDANANPSQQAAAVTQLFYDINWLHDWYYAAGFDEAAGNAQTSNFGRGGLEGDAMLAEAQDNSGVNNANMATPADGMPPRMQMFLWEFGPSSLEVTGPPGLAGSYEVGAAGFAPQDFRVEGPLRRADPIDGCAPLVGDYAGAIVLIDRGGEACGPNAFGAKAAAAQAAGAAGALIANVETSNEPERAPNAGGDPPFPITIGVLTLSLADGDRLRGALAAGEELGAALAKDTLLRDSDFDNQIVAHEWGHYISNRLVHDSTGLGTNMARGLGEGWGDFHALLLTVRPEDAQQPGNERWQGAYAVGAYASGQLSSDSQYFGTRRYPYSTDLTKNPLSFKHISNESPLPEDVPRNGSGDNTEVHNLGEVWASLLWECYAALLRDTLGEAPRLSFVEAQARMRDYLVAAYKLTPQDPTLLEARDALLAAALGRDLDDLRLFSQAFARRGAGVFAVAPERRDASNAGVVESFAAGAALDSVAARLSDDVAPVCGGDGVLDAGETGTLRVTFRNIGNVPSEAATATVASPLDGVTFPDGASVTIPPLDISASAEVALRVALAGVSEITPLELLVQPEDIGAGEPPARRHGFLAHLDDVPERSFVDSVESPNVAWAVEVSSDEVPPEARWRRVAESLVQHVYDAPSAPLAATVDLVSPPLRVAREASFVVSLRHRHSFEAAEGLSFDGGVVEISDDGGETWRDIGQEIADYNGALFEGSDNPLPGRAAFVADSPGYPDFTPTTFDFGAAYGGRSVQLRFRVASDAAISSPGWQLDDIRVSGVGQAPFPAIVPHSAVCAPQAPESAAPAAAL